VKFILTFFLLCSLSFADLTDRTQKLVPQLQENFMMIGRLGRSDVQPGFVISKAGHVLVAHIPSIDQTDSPYLLYQSDGSRIILETVFDDGRKPLALLKFPEGVEPPVGEVVVSDSALESQQWFFLPRWSPSPALIEPSAIILTEAERSSGGLTLKSETAFYPGSPVFDLAGRFVAVTLPYRKKDAPNQTRTILFTEFVQKVEEFTQLNFIKDATKIGKVNQTQPRPQSLPVGVILNGDQPAAHSVNGTIIDSNGLILTKASELGPELFFQYEGEKYPAVLLSVDTATDLALVGVEAQNLPVIQWNSSDQLKPGTIIYHRSLLGDISQEMEVSQEIQYGLVSHQLPRNSISIHQIQRVTALGIVPEQTENKLVIAAVRVGTPAEKADIKVGDQLTKIDGQLLSDRHDLAVYLSKKSVGNEVRLTLQREDQIKEMTLALMSEDLKPDPTGIPDIDRASCIPSVHRGPFPRLLVNALLLNAWDCGAPVFDENQRAYGIHIAAVNGGYSLALPSEVVQAAVKRMIRSKTL